MSRLEEGEDPVGTEPGVDACGYGRGEGKEDIHGLAMARNIPQFTRGGRTVNGNPIKPVKIRKRREEAAYIVYIKRDERSNENTNRGQCHD